MEIVLVSVTLLALLTTICMSVVTWRLVQEERRRSDARVAALAAELALLEASPLVQPAPLSDARAAEAATGIEQKETSARPSRAPQAVADGRIGDLAGDNATGNTLAGHILAFDNRVDTGSLSGEAPSPPMFAAALGRDENTSHRLFSAFVTGTLAATFCLGLVVSLAFLSGGDAPAQAPDGAAAHPLELLSANATADNRRVRLDGVVLNPSSAASLPGVTAVASFYAQDGSFLGSGRGEIGKPLRPGEPSPFTVVGNVAGDVARYRVSFRGFGDSPLAHVDRREGR